MPELVCAQCTTPVANSYVTWRDEQGNTTKVWCKECDELDRILRYRKDRVLTSQLTLNASLFAVRDELARKNRTFRLGTDPKEWGRQINDLRNVPSTLR